MINNMSNGYMTPKKYNEQKDTRCYNRQDYRLIKDLYPSVMEIVVEYKTLHLSPFGENTETGEYEYNPNKRTVFEIDCPNRECSIGFFDLKNEIRDMIYLRQIEGCGVMKCQGGEAYDHLNQRCDSTLEYKISIMYNNYK